MALAIALLLTLSVWLAPAAEALPSYLTAPWTPLSDSNGNDGSGLTAPWTPLSTPSGNDGLALTAPWTPLSDPNGDDGVVFTAPSTPLPVPWATDGSGGTSGTFEGLLASDIAAAIVPGGPFTAPATALASVPEPSTVILLGLGILALMIMGWRRADSLRRSR